jgi:hypothetical protein
MHTQTGMMTSPLCNDRFSSSGSRAPFACDANVESAPAMPTTTAAPVTLAVTVANPALLSKWLLSSTECATKINETISTLLRAKKVMHTGSAMRSCDSISTTKAPSRISP